MKITNVSTSVKKGSRITMALDLKGFLKSGGSDRFAVTILSRSPRAADHWESIIRDAVKHRADWNATKKGAFSFQSSIVPQTSVLLKPISDGPSDPAGSTETAPADPKPIEGQKPQGDDVGDPDPAPIPDPDPDWLPEPQPQPKPGDKGSTWKPFGLF